MDRRILPACGALVLIACNALSGAGDLEVCQEAACASSSGASSSSGSASVPDSGVVVDRPSTAACSEGAKRCEGRSVATCTGGTWSAPTACAETCLDGGCVPWPSCRAASDATCGTGATSCCESKAVPGGTFDRRNNDAYPATVSAFQLDTYEVTVGRFRTFVDAGFGTQAKPPASGAAAHPKIAGSGWSEAWNTLLPPATADLREFLAGGTWTDSASANENKPITNVPWFVAFAFCAWDGGRLPTYAEWNFAAAGGDDQRYYAWSSPAPSTDISASRAAYNCNYDAPPFTCPAAYCSASGMSPCDPTTCSNAGGVCITPSCFGCEIAKDVAPVGVLTAGAGRWGHFDLGGNASEMVLDAYTEKSGPGADIDPLIVPCADCAALMPVEPRATGAGPTGKKDSEFFVAGGSWNEPNTSVRSSSYLRRKWDHRAPTIGFRCARD